MSGTISRRAHRGNVDPAIGKKLGYYNNRKNSTGGRRYFYQGILSNRPNKTKKETIISFRKRLRIWKLTAKPIKFVRHDKYS